MNYPNNAAVEFHRKRKSIEENLGWLIRAELQELASHASDAGFLDFGLKVGVSVQTVTTVSQNPLHRRFSHLVMRVDVAIE